MIYSLRRGNDPVAPLSAYHLNITFLPINTSYKPRQASLGAGRLRSPARWTLDAAWGLT
jgi:hypothetical protein